MNASIMQPNFLPWQGFFELLARSDIFVLLDDVQLSVQGWNQRNRLFVNPGQVGWYTVPVKKKGFFRVPINQALINDAVPWRKKTWKRLVQNYGSLSFFQQFGPKVETWLKGGQLTMAELNVDFIRMVSKWLNFLPQFVKSSELGLRRERSAGVLDILERIGAKCYYSAAGSFGYMSEDGIFPASSIELLFQDFRPRPYEQVGAKEGFEPRLSILDALFNIGPEKTAELIITGTPHWRTWQEMGETTS